MTAGPLIKICGVTSVADALLCAEAGANALGLNFWPGSPRCCSLATAAAIAAALEREHPSVLRIGVFVNASAGELTQAIAAAGLHVVQHHGDEVAEVDPPVAGAPRQWKGLRLQGAEDLGLLTRYARPAWELCVIDAPSPAYGGSGRRLDVALAAQAAALRPLLLAGGLTPETVAEAIRAVRPQGVDVASGVEAAPGRKDPARVRAFVRAACAALQ